MHITESLHFKHIQVDSKENIMFSDASTFFFLFFNLRLVVWLITESLHFKHIQVDSAENIMFSKASTFFLFSFSIFYLRLVVWLITESLHFIHIQADSEENIMFSQASTFFPVPFCEQFSKYKLLNRWKLLTSQLRILVTQSQRLKGIETAFFEKAIVAKNASQGFSTDYSFRWRRTQTKTSRQLESVHSQHSKESGFCSARLREHCENGSGVVN